MKIKLSLLNDVEDLYEDFLRHLGLSKSQYKKSGMKKNLSMRGRKEIELPCALLRNGEVNPVYTGPEIKVISESVDFLALSKPFGVHGHPQGFEETDTVLNFLREIGKTNDFGGAEGGLLYRLDQETSGVLVLAKREVTYNELRDNFHTLAKEKIYLAVVKGKFDSLGEKTHYLKSSGDRGSIQKEDESGIESKLSIAKSWYDEKSDNSLLQIVLETGVRHQIRAQLSFMGFPILGDTLYGGEKEERLFLHALKYAFDWEGKRVVFYDGSPLLFNKFFDLNSCL